MSAQHTTGPWKVCQWNDGKSFTVWREVQPGNGLMRIERMLNASGNRKRFRSEASARAAIAKATG
jgi:hypothetical protein